MRSDDAPESTTESGRGPDPEPESGHGRTWWITGILLVSAWFLYLYIFGPKFAGNAPVLEGTALARPADYNWTPHDLDGRPVSFSEFRGKTVFLNIWATWCPPCVAELPSIARLARTPGLEHVAFVCLATDEEPGTVRRFLQGKDWPMTILQEPGSRLPAVFTSDGIPATFLIAPDGQVAASTLGSATWDAPSVVEFLKRLATQVPKPEASRGQKTPRSPLASNSPPESAVSAR